MTFFIDVCKVNGDYESIKEKITEDFRLLLEAQSKGKIKEADFQKKLQDFTDKLKDIKLDSVINLDCIINTLVNGVTFSSVVTFWFLILFIIGFFIKL